MNIPDKFPSAVRQYGNHFLDSLLCILNHNFYRNIRKGCYAPQMRQGLDKYSHRNGTVIKHKKGDFRVPELWFPNFRIRDFEPQEYSLSMGPVYVLTVLCYKNEQTDILLIPPQYEEILYKPRIEIIMWARYFIRKIR